MTLFVATQGNVGFCSSERCISCIFGIPVKEGRIWESPNFFFEMGQPTEKDTAIDKLSISPKTLGAQC